MAGKKKKKSKDKVFTDRDRKVFRNYIGKWEIGFSVFFIVFVGLMTWWFVDQEDNYDPGERDIAMEVLVEQQVEDNLYKAPLKRWVDPAEAAVVGRAAGPSIEPFPAAMVSNGWRDSSRVQEFDWDTLYEKIDGAEAQYKAYGFQRAWFLGLTNEAEGWDMNIEMYDMTTFTNALGIFSAQRSADADIQRQGNAFYYLTEIGAIGMVENYYFKLAGNAPEQGIIDHAQLFIEEFEPTVEPSADRPEMFAALLDNYGFDAISYVREDAFQYAFCKNFWFVKPDPDSELRLYMHEAESADAASTLFDQFAEEQSFEYEEVSRDENKIVFKHQFLDTFFVLAKSGAMIYGVEGAATADEAAASLGTLEDLVSSI